MSGSRRPRILLVCDWFLKYAGPQAAGLVEAGADVTLLCINRADEFGGDDRERQAEVDRISRGGVRVIQISRRRRAARSAPEAVRVWVSIARWRPDIVHAHGNFDPRLYLMTRAWPTVVTVHDPQPHPGEHELPRLAKLVWDRWVRRARVVVVHSPALVDRLPTWVHPSRVAVVPHGATPASEPLPPPATPHIVLFGRLEPYKGVGILVSAARRLWRARPDVRFSILGTGPASGEVPADSRFETRFEYIPEHEVEAILASASIVVLPYTEASQSGVGLLAISRGVPVVVSRLGGLPELALDDRFVVTPGDPCALAHALARQLDHGIGLRQQVLDHAARQFSWLAAGRTTLALYRERGLVATEPT